MREAILGPIWQLGYVVDDLEVGVMRWAERGAGPFFRRAPEPAAFFDRFYGGHAPVYDTQVALGQFGSVMLELIAPPEGGVTPRTPGLHHIASFPRTSTPRSLPSASAGSRR